MNIVSDHFPLSLINERSILTTGHMDTDWGTHWGTPIFCVKLNNNPVKCIICLILFDNTYVLINDIKSKKQSFNGIIFSHVIHYTNKSGHRPCKIKVGLKSIIFSLDIAWFEANQHSAEKGLSRSNVWRIFVICCKYKFVRIV